MALRDLDSSMQKNETRSPTYTIHKINSRCIKDLTCEKMAQHHYPSERCKLKSFCMAKENSTKMKKESTVWENIFTNDTSDKGLISKVYKDLT